MMKIFVSIFLIALIVSVYAEDDYCSHLGENGDSTNNKIANPIMNYTNCSLYDGVDSIYFEKKSSFKLEIYCLVTNAEGLNKIK